MPGLRASYPLDLCCLDNGARMVSEAMRGMIGSSSQRNMAAARTSYELQGVDGRMV